MRGMIKNTHKKMINNGKKEGTEHGEKIQKKQDTWFFKLFSILCYAAPI